MILIDINNSFLSACWEVKIEKDNGGEAIAALKSINALYTASLLEEAMEIYKNGPATYSEDEQEEEELSEEQEEKLDELDNKFYEYKDNLLELQIKYIREHISDF